MRSASFSLLRVPKRGSSNIIKQNMTLRILLIAAAALICHCAADVAHINQSAPKDVLVPFNDLLPPPLEESTTEAAAPPPTKPSKKSYYQQQQQKQELEQARSRDSQISAETLPQLQLARDLLPPFVEAVEDSSSTASPTSTSTTSTTTSTTRPTSAFSSSSSSSGTRQPAALPHVAQPPLARVVARANGGPSEYSAASRFSPELIRHYATYFQFTTHRPPRGPLPTLTPFPRHIRI